ncbi:class I SAM-dependent methyltransferase [Streptomyces sp. NBC_01233]|uniref:class I SAM-dependent methyltransferase n=1 Tax=Streptomyces sp. NBC_01233 TaxID=2903787 RepID=UPI002E0E6F3C|nr:class I SAM-dependent methyltransferase [Streptomyces sp. NBC_01233]
MSFSKRYLDRARAGAFGSVAQQYDLYRPSYPEALINRLVASSPAAVLDIGCGTGKVATALAKHRLPVLGLEPDSRMAEMARANGVTVEVAMFEDWDGAGRTFDLLTSGDAWHWIDPVEGRRKAADLLNPGGLIARFWNVHEAEPALLRAFEAVYREWAPDVTVAGGVPKSTRNAPDSFADDPAFAICSSDTYSWELTLTAEEWVGLVTTFSDHQQLAPEQLATLLDGLRAVIERHGGTVRTRSGTFVQLAERA